jgi:hypothetical protein
VPQPAVVSIYPTGVRFPAFLVVPLERRRSFSKGWKWGPAGQKAMNRMKGPSEAQLANNRYVIAITALPETASLPFPVAERTTYKTEKTVQAAKAAVIQKRPKKIRAAQRSFA